jgi:hypothetical protein
VVRAVRPARGGSLALKIRTDGPATLEVLDKEEPSGLNPLEAEPKVMATVEIDTQGDGAM